MYYILEKSKRFKFTIFTLISMIISFFILQDYRNQEIITFIIMLTFASFIIFFLDTDYKIKYFAIIILLFKSVYLLYLNYIGEIYLFPDSIQYIEILDRIISSESFMPKRMISIAGTLHVGFYYFFTPIYILFENSYSIIIMNLILTSISSILMYEIAKKLYSDKIAIFTFIFFNLSVNIGIFGSHILKDPLVIFFTVLSLYLYLIKDRTIFSLISAIFLITIRIYSGAAVIIAILFDLFIKNKIDFKNIGKFIVISIPVIYILLIKTSIKNYLILMINFLKGTNIFEAIYKTLLTLVKFYFSPLPWNLETIENIYIFMIIDSFIMLFFSFAIIFYIYKIFKYKNLRRKTYIFIIPVLINAFALGQQYDGNSTRQRSGIYIFLILFIAIGLFYKKDKKSFT